MDLLLTNIKEFIKKEKIKVIADKLKIISSYGENKLYYQNNFISYMTNPFELICTNISEFFRNIKKKYYPCLFFITNENENIISEQLDIIDSTGLFKIFIMGKNKKLLQLATKKNLEYILTCNLTYNGMINSGLIFLKNQPNYLEFIFITNSDTILPSNIITITKNRLQSNILIAGCSCKKNLIKSNGSSSELELYNCKINKINSKKIFGDWFFLNKTLLKTQGWNIFEKYNLDDIIDRFINCDQIFKMDDYGTVSLDNFLHKELIKNGIQINRETQIFDFEKELLYRHLNILEDFNDYKGLLSSLTVLVNNKEEKIINYEIISNDLPISYIYVICIKYSRAYLEDKIFKLNSDKIKFTILDIDLIPLDNYRDTIFLKRKILNLKVIRDAIEKKYKRIAIVEDDLFVNLTNILSENKLILPKEWDGIIFLNGVVNGSFTKILNENKNILKNRGNLDNYGFLLNFSLYNEVIENLLNNVTISQFFNLNYEKKKLFYYYDNLTLQLLTVSPGISYDNYQFVPYKSTTLIHIESKLNNYLKLLLAKTRNILYKYNYRPNHINYQLQTPFILSSDIGSSWYDMNLYYKNPKIFEDSYPRSILVYQEERNQVNKEISLINPSIFTYKESSIIKVQYPHLQNLDLLELSNVSPKIISSNPEKEKVFVYKDINKIDTEINLIKPNLFSFDSEDDNIFIYPSGVKLFDITYCKPPKINYNESKSNLFVILNNNINYKLNEIYPTIINYNEDPGVFVYKDVIVHDYTTSLSKPNILDYNEENKLFLYKDNEFSSKNPIITLKEPNKIVYNKNTD